ncbi:MFS transporter [Phytoactinopolyspora mesophila]|uniref:MFS transporter n=1 Tax=Phytoactinopolyspora mesophila TaxID=2650750 RepID=A0A7K3M3J6_9ACTN|nr:MFS transporter [Phytoactinopolyspora mesophila]NDL57482.1 MFS transporter [Phytoactinopolyspora mesophila]
MSPLRPGCGKRRSLPVSYLGAAFFGRLAEEGAPVVVVLLALDRTGDVWLGGLLVAATTLPHIVTGPLAGHLRDRTGRPVAVTALAAMLVAAAYTTLAATTGLVPWPLAILSALAAGAAGPLLLGGLSSLIGGLVTPAGRPAAHAVDSATYNVAGIAGPGLGATVSAVVSPAAGLYCLAAAAAAGAICATSIPPGHDKARQTPGTPPGGIEVGPRLLAGFIWIWRVPVLRTTTVVTTLAHAGLGGLAVIAPLLAVHLGSSESTGGYFLSAFAAGAGVGSLLMAHRRAKGLPPVPVVLVSLALLSAALGLGALAPTPALALCCFAIAGFADGPLLAMTLLVRTEASPPTARTQVFMVGASLKLTFAAGGAIACGFAAGAGGPTLLLAVAAVVAASILPGLRHRDLPRNSRQRHGTVST